MRVVVAPDKFKGSLSAPRVAHSIALGLLSIDPSATVDLVPVADGGEGTLDAAIGSGFEQRTVVVAGPTGAPLEAAFGVRGREAVIEMASASGLGVLPGGRRDALRATSRGTGDLIVAALDAGCTRIVLGVGGSANTDGGAGLVSALGVRLLDSDGAELPDGGSALIDLARIDPSGIDQRLAAAEFILASDVDNPLLGANGAAAVFAPQKGATPADVAVLENALTRFATLLGETLGEVAVRSITAPGSGAAGGVGFAALAVLGAARRPGVEVVLEFTGFAEKLVGADLVVTGEGSLDEQSLGGKTPIGVANAAALAGVPVVAVCGRTTLGAAELAGAGFSRTYALTDYEPDVALCMTNAGALLEHIGTVIGTGLRR
jgi:glycerate kinase